MIEVQNKKTKRCYFLSKQEWEQITINGKADKYILVGEAKEIKRPTTPIPEEVKTVIKKQKI